MAGTNWPKKPITTSNTYAGNRELDAADMPVERKMAVLRSSKEILSLRKEGKSVSNQYAVLVTRPKALSLSRYAIIASKAVGGAVERNRCKRRMRSRVAKFSSRFANRYDFVLICRKTLLDVESAVLDESILDLFKRAGIVLTDE